MVFFHASVERLAGYAERLCHLRQIVVILLECVDNGALLYFIEREAVERHHLARQLRRLLSILTLKVRGLQLIGSTHEQGALDQILKFANVAGIGQLRQIAHRRLGYLHRRHVVEAAYLVGKVSHEERNVASALPQRRQRHGNKIYAVEKVFAECAVTHHLRQIGIGGTHHPYVDLARSALAKHLESVLLKHPEQLHLTAHVEVAYLVEEYRALVGYREAAFTVGGGSGESSFLVSEHLALKQ